MQETLRLDLGLQRPVTWVLGVEARMQAEWIHIVFSVTWLQGQCGISERLDVFTIMSHNRP